MAEEPTPNPRQIEEALKACATMRRHQAGAPFVLRPDQRKALQDEIALGWNGLPPEESVWVRWSEILLPRWRWLAGATAVFAVFALLMLNLATPKSKLPEVARSQRALEVYGTPSSESSVVAADSMPQPTPVPEVEVELAKVDPPPVVADLPVTVPAEPVSLAAPLAATAVPASVPEPEPGPMEPSIPQSSSTDLTGQAIAEVAYQPPDAVIPETTARDASTELVDLTSVTTAASVPDLAASKSSVAERAEALAQRSIDVPPAATEMAAAAPMRSTAAGDGAAEFGSQAEARRLSRELAVADSLQVRTAEPAARMRAPGSRARVGGVGATTDSMPDEARLSSPIVAGGTADQRFTQSQARPLRRNPNSPAPPPVLQEFRFQQIPAGVQIVDRDGSIYRAVMQGPSGVQPASSPAPQRSPAAVSQSRPYSVAGRPAGDQSTGGNELRFQAVGTNRSLNQRVVFDGWLVFTNEALAAPSVPVTPASQDPRALSVWINNSLVTGEARVGSRTRLSVEAAPAP